MFQHGTPRHYELSDKSITVIFLFIDLFRKERSNYACILHPKNEKMKKGEYKAI